jgi:hypothetical protein
MICKAYILKESVMKHFEKKIPAGARRTSSLFWVTLLALVLSGGGAAAFPINFAQDKNSQEKNYDAAAAKRFAGVWKVKEHPRDIAYRVVTIRLEDEKLTAAVRSSLIYYEPGTGIGRIAEERDHPLHTLAIVGPTLTSRMTWKKESGGEIQNLETLFRMTIVSDDEIKVECAGEPSPYDGLVLKREK